MVLTENGLRKRAKPVVTGFDFAGKRLNNVFYAMMLGKPPPPTAAGNINTAQMQLKTLFTGAIGCPSRDAKAQTICAVVTLSPLGNASTGTSTRSSTDSLPLSNPSGESPHLADSDVNNKLLAPLAQQYDDNVVVVSSKNHNMCRIKIDEMLRMMITDEFTLVIPPLTIPSLMPLVSQGYKFSEK